MSDNNYVTIAYLCVTTVPLSQDGLYRLELLEEVNRTHPWCPKCDMFVSHKALNVRNLTTNFCRQGEEQKRCQLAEEETREGTAPVITTC